MQPLTLLAAAAIARIPEHYKGVVQKKHSDEARNSDSTILHILLAPEANYISNQPPSDIGWADDGFEAHVDKDSNGVYFRTKSILCGQSDKFMEFYSKDTLRNAEGRNKVMLYKTQSHLVDQISLIGNVSGVVITLGRENDERKRDEAVTLLKTLSTVKNENNLLAVTLIGSRKQLEEIETDIPSLFVKTNHSRWISHIEEKGTRPTTLERIRKAEEDPEKSTLEPRKLRDLRDAVRSAEILQKEGLTDRAIWGMGMILAENETYASYLRENVPALIMGEENRHDFATLQSAGKLTNIAACPMMQEWIRNFNGAIHNEDGHYTPHNPWIRGVSRLESSRPGNYQRLTEKQIPEEITNRYSQQSWLYEPNEDKAQLTINNKMAGKGADMLSELELATDNMTVGLFNPVSNRIESLAKAGLSRISISRQGLSWVNELMENLGYQVTVSDEVITRINKLQADNLKTRTPNYPLTGYETIAYYNNGDRVAEEDYTDPQSGQPVWQKGKAYRILPLWEKRNIPISEEVLQEQEDITTEAPEAQGRFCPETNVRGHSQSDLEKSTVKKSLRSTCVTHGYSTFHVASESGSQKILEIDSESSLARRAEHILSEIEGIDAALDALPIKSGNNRIENEIKTLTERKSTLETSLDTQPIPLEDFMRVFPPEPPPLATDLYADRIKASATKMSRRFSDTYRMLPEQLMAASLATLKGSAILNCPPGGGKTLQSIMSAHASGTHYWWVVCQTKVMNTWVREIEKAGFPLEVVGAEKKKGKWVESGRGYAQLKDIDRRCHARERIAGRDGKMGPQFFIISSEVVSYGFGSNFQTDPWYTDYVINQHYQKLKDVTGKTEQEFFDELDPSLWGCIQRVNNTDDKQVVRIWSRRMDNEKTLEMLGLRKVFQVKNIKHSKIACPVCEEKGNFSNMGTCGCGHIHRYQSIGSDKETTNIEFKRMLKLKGYSPKWVGAVPSTIVNLPGKKVLSQFPGYKLMSKHVRGKIIDEAHEIAGIDSQRGRAVQQIKTNRTILSTGTICRTKVRELEAMLSLVHKPNSEPFPYAAYDLGGFRQDFISESVVTVIRGEKINTVRKEIPEPSNITRLRSLMHGVLCPIAESTVESSWGLKRITEKIHYVDLQGEESIEALGWYDTLTMAAERLRLNREDMEARNDARNALGQLSYAFESEGKLRTTLEWARKCIREGNRGVIVGPSKNFYNRVKTTLEEAGIPFLEVNGKESSHQRSRVLDDFRESDCPILLSRIRLINVNYNQLTCCQRILFTGLDPSPAAIRQMQKRLNRIGQTKDVECTFLISRMPPNLRYQSIRNIRHRILRINEAAGYAVIAAAPAPGNPANINSSVDTVAADINAILTGNAPGNVTDMTPQQAEENQSRNAVGSQRVPLKGYIVTPEEAFLNMVMRREKSIRETTQRVTTPRSTMEIVEETRKREDFEATIKDILENTSTLGEVSEVEGLTIDDISGTQRETTSQEATGVLTVASPEEETETKERTVKKTARKKAKATKEKDSENKPEKPTPNREEREQAVIAGQALEENEADRNWSQKTNERVWKWLEADEAADRNKGVTRKKNKVSPDQGLLFD